MQDTTKVLLRADQVAGYRDEKERIDKTLENPLVRSQLQNPAGLKRMSNNIGKILEDQAPRELTIPERDRLQKREIELRDKWTHNMPTGEVMRKNPPGAVNHHRQWEAHNKAAIKEWKNIRRQLEPTSEDPDLANIERYRPGGQLDLFRSDAQIPGTMTYGSVPQEKWDDAFGKDSGPNSALKQVKARKARKPLSPEQLQAARDRMANARSARKQEQGLGLSQTVPNEDIAMAFGEPVSIEEGIAIQAKEELKES